MASGDETFTYVNHLPEIMAALDKAVGKAVEKTAKAIATTYEATAPRQTGFMASSAYTRTTKASTYGQGLAGTGPMLPEVEKPENDMTAWAAVAATYAAYPEMGTVHAAAQPAFVPAVDNAAKVLEAELSNLERAIADEVGKG